MGSEETVSFPHADAPTVLLFVAADCPVCGEVFPALTQLRDTLQSKAAVHMISQDEEMLEDEHDMNRRLARGCFLPHHADIAFPVFDDSKLAASLRWAPEVLPALVTLDESGAEVGRVEGWERAEWEAEVPRVSELLGSPQPPIAWGELPPHLEGCGSKHGFLDAGGSSFVSRQVTVGDEDDIFEFMADAGFTDGLPVVPPTPERVARMLKGTIRDPTEIIAKVPPLYGDATIEKIAVNAVMAGCKPEYMPVILAALEAICTDTFNCHGVWATTMSAAPVMVINGPVREKIGLNSGRNALGSGMENRANLTIGRAIKLIVQNVGGAKPGFSEMATVGAATKNFATCFGEREERAEGWEPLHVERGYEAGDSVVTCIALTSCVLLNDQTSRTARQLAGTFAAALKASWSNRSAGLADTLLLVCPEHYDTFRRDNWDKRMLRDYIYQHSAVSADELVNDEEMGGSGFVNTPDGLAKAIEAGKARPMPKFREVNEAGDFGLSIVLAGGDAGKFSYFFSGWAGGAMGSIPTSERIES